MIPPSPDPARDILGYLEVQLPGYPFSPTIDPAFVGELLDDFPHADILEEIKSFRWYHDNDPAARVANLRLAIRRWIAKGTSRGRP